ncbi:polysaccharide lyase family 8 protein [Collybiopsis luxurians FD-317 M1]|uniref:Polysaccharide lyase family 8 protein n=1 Tax=Collybiopsis luxurians FD-317 M1 TaxID=944289 RepID=A0A0D0C1Q7_9AGAR|nr:polysaccharide lyase family 8 protein [Collybiopsis luxurians FD-317 M1]
MRAVQKLFYVVQLLSALGTANAANTSDIELIQQRRIELVVNSLALSNETASEVENWCLSLNENGTWSDVDYTTGCAAQRANWPAENHWSRLETMAGIWYTSQNNDTIPQPCSGVLQSKIAAGMDWWFSHDFSNPACLDSGGTPACPCDPNDDTMWNTNWFSNIIGVPSLVGPTCLLMNSSLTTAEINNCTRMTARGFGAFNLPFVNGLAPNGVIAGANTLDVAKVGIDSALLSGNVSMVADAYGRINGELQIRNGIKADGVRPDGSFGQHEGILYNGNYGQVYSSDVLDLELIAAGTQYSGNTTTINTMETIFNGDAWMIYQNEVTGVLHWDFSVLGRFISFPVADKQATSGIHLNLSEVAELGNVWSSQDMIHFASSLANANGTSANAGALNGDKVFFANDYMVHRGSNYVSTLKMYSTRTNNTECTNSQNPFGFHLSDGVLYTYLQGDEYEDIAAAWDWNLIPGITVDYNATQLTCAETSFTGVESFVGGVSNAQVGVGVMRYTNPLTRKLTWQKAWFMLPDDVQRVMVSGIKSESGAPVYTVLDQKRRSGEIFVAGSGLTGGHLSFGNESGTQTLPISASTTLWHDGVGYKLGPDNGIKLNVRSSTKVGNWSQIGISTQPPAEVSLFSAWLEHSSNLGSNYVPATYTAFPGLDYTTFTQRAQDVDRYIKTISNDDNVSALIDEKHGLAMAVFWGKEGSISFSLCGSESDIGQGNDFQLSVDGNVALIWDLVGNILTISDPSQSLASVNIRVQFPSQSCASSKDEKSLLVVLPKGGESGNSTTVAIASHSSS